jgi:hypothetical protein
MREHRRESFRKVSTCENFRKFSITSVYILWLCHLVRLWQTRTNRQFTVYCIIKIIDSSEDKLSYHCKCEYSTLTNSSLFVIS